MSTRRLSLFLFLSIAAVAAEKDRFRVEEASSYPYKQTSEGLTIAAVPYTTSDQAKPAFGKTNPYELGVLPILVVMQNDTGEALRLDQMTAFYVQRDRSRVEATPASDVPYLQGAARPSFGGSPIPPLPIPKRQKKSKLAIPEIEGLALNAKMIPPHDAVHGFLYFQTGHRRGSTLYISGIVEASSGRELLYFEVPLDE